MLAPTAAVLVLPLLIISHKLLSFLFFLCHSAWPLMSSFFFCSTFKVNFGETDKCKKNRWISPISLFFLQDFVKSRLRSVDP